MSVEKPSDDLLKQWEQQLSESGLSMRRGEHRRLVYGHKDTCRVTEMSKECLSTWVKQERKPHKPHKPHVKHQQTCGVCGGVFEGRKGAMSCSTACRVKKLRAKSV